MADAAEIRRSICPNICKQCRPQCKMWQEISNLEGPKLKKYIKTQQEEASRGAGSPHKIEMARAARSSGGSPSQPKMTCCGNCDIILEQISKLLTEIWDILGPEQKVNEPCILGRSRSCECQQCRKHSSQGYSQDFGPSSPKERYLSWLTKLRPILLSVLEGVKRGRHQIYKGEPKDELEKLLEQLRIPLSKQARNIRITSLTNIPLSSTERDAGLVTSLIENTALLEKVLARIKNESDLIEMKLRQEKSKAFEMHDRTDHLPELKPTHYYDEAENLRTVYLPEHKPTHYYDAAGNLRPAHLPEHKPTHYYDEAGNLRTAYLPEHKPTHYYDAAGNLRTTHHPEHKPTHYYDAAGNLRPAHLPEYKPTHYYDEAGNLRTAYLPEHKPTHYYDAAGNLRTTHHPEHKPTHYYDAAGNLRPAHLPEHKPTHYYDATGNLRPAHLPKHKPTHYYDELGNLRTVYLPEHKPTHYYDAAGNLRPAHLPEHTPTHYYDEAGNLRTNHLPEHKPTQYYDAAGNLRTAHLPEHKPTHYYDEAGNLRKTHLPEHKPTHYYDGAGNLRTAHLPEHKPTHYYDEAGNLRKTHLPEHKPTQYYDAAGNLRTAHLPEHKPTHYYDEAGNLRKTHLPEHKPTHYYDGAGNLRTAHIPEHKPTHYYDGAGNLRTAHLPEHKPTHYYDAEGNLRPAHLPEHTPTHYYDEAGNLRTTHLPENKPTQYYDAAGNLRTAHLPEHKPTHYYDEAGNLRKTHRPEHKPTHYYDGAGNLRTAHLPEHKPTHYYDAAGNLRPVISHKKSAQKTRSASTVSEASDYVMFPPISGRTKSGRKEDRSGGATYMKEDRIKQTTDRTRSTKEDEMKLKRGATFTKEETSDKRDQRQHLAKAGYADKDRRSLSVERYDKRLPKTIDSRSSPEKRDKSPKRFATPPGVLKVRTIKGTIQHAGKERTGKRTVEMKQKVQKASPKGDIKYRGRWPKEPSPSRGDLIKKSANSEKDQKGIRGTEGHVRTGSGKDHVRTGSEKDHARSGGKKDHVRTGSDNGHARTGSEKDQSRPGSEKDQSRPGSKKEHAITGSDKDRVRTGSDKDRVRTVSEKDHVRKGSDRDHTRTGSEKDHVRTGSEKDHARSGGKKGHVRTGSDKGHARTGSEKDQSRPGSKKEHAITGSDKDRVRTGSEKDRTTLEDHVKTGSDKGHARTGSDKDRVRTVSEKDHVRKGSDRDHTRTGSEKDHVKSGGKKDLVIKGSEKDRSRLGSEKNHVKSRGEKDHVKTGSAKDHSRTGSENRYLKTGGKKEHVKTGSERDQARTGSDKDYEKTADEKDRVKTGGEKDREKTGGKKSRAKIGSEKAQEGGSEMSLTKQNDTSSKPGRRYYKGIPVTMKDEAQRGGLKVKVLKGAVETKIKKVIRHPSEISGTLKEVSKNELISRKKKQGSKNDPDVKRKKTIVSEVPSNVILKRMNAQRMQELRLARNEARMQRAPPRKLKSIKSLPNVHLLLKKKKKKIKVTDSDTGITICTGLEEPPEMIQGDIVVPLESMAKHEHTPVNPLLFKVEADFQDDDPLSALLPSIPALKATSKTDHKHQSKILTLKSSKQKQKIEKPLDNKGVIVYKLSDPQFIDMGYTKLPAVNVMRKVRKRQQNAQILTQITDNGHLDTDKIRKSFIYKMVQPNPKEDWFRRHIRHRVIYYDTCEKLAEIDDDGHGCWYYKNGRVALKYYAAEEKYAENRYIIYSSGEKDENGNPRCVTVLATFDHVGNGIVYDHCGNIRLKYNQNKGENFDTTIGATGRWKWHSMTTTLSSLQNVYVEEHMKLASQSTLNVIQEMAKEGVSSDVPEHHKYDKKEHIHMLTTEMENFMREKKELLLQKYKTFELKLKAFKLNEEFSLRIYEQTKIWLYFNVGSRNLKLNLGLRLISSDILGTEMVNLNEIDTPFDRVIPVSESISNILDIIRETKKHERKKIVAKKYFSDFKNTSSRLEVVN